MAWKWSLWDNGAQVYNRVGEASTEAMEAVGKLLVDKIQEKMLYGYDEPHGPDGHTEIVDTGKLFDSVKYEVHPTKNHIATVVVGTDMSAVNRSGKPYAVYVHQGTSKLHGRPFIFDSVNENRAEMKERIQNAYKDL